VKGIKKPEMDILVEYLNYGLEIDEEMYRVKQRRLRKLEDDDRLSMEDLKEVRKEA
jgi:hypothetical protein